MKRVHLIDRAIDATALDRPTAAEAVNVLFESVRSALKRGDRVVLRGFGVFHTAPRREGVARNPRTGEPVDIPRGLVARFRPATSLRSLRV